MHVIYVKVCNIELMKNENESTNDDDGKTDGGNGAETTTTSISPKFEFVKKLVRKGISWSERVRTI